VNVREEGPPLNGDAAWVALSTASKVKNPAWIKEGHRYCSYIYHKYNIPSATSLRSILTGMSFRN
jgi:hypothetical protein